MKKANLELPFEKAGKKGMKWRKGTKSWRDETQKRFEEQTGRAREREAKEQAKLKELEGTLKRKENEKDWHGAEEARIDVKNFKEEIGPDLSESEKHHITKSKGPWKRGKGTFLRDRIGVIRNTKFMDPAKLKEGFMSGEYQPVKSSHEERFAKAKQKMPEWPVVSKHGVHIAHRRKTLGDVVLGAARGVRSPFDKQGHPKSDLSKRTKSPAEKDFDEIREWQKRKAE